MGALPAAEHVPGQPAITQCKALLQWYSCHCKPPLYVAHHTTPCCGLLLHCMCGVLSLNIDGSNGRVSRAASSSWSAAQLSPAAGPALVGPLLLSQQQLQPLQPLKLLWPQQPQLHQQPPLPACAPVLCLAAAFLIILDSLSSLS